MIAIFVPLYVIILSLFVSCYLFLEGEILDGLILSSIAIVLVFAFGVMIDLKVKWNLFVLSLVLCITAYPLYEGSKAYATNNINLDQLVSSSDSRKEACDAISSYTWNRDILFSEESALIKALNVERMTGKPFGYCSEQIEEAKRMWADRILDGILIEKVAPLSLTRLDGSKETFSEILSYFFDDEVDKAKSMIRAKYPSFVKDENGVLTLTYMDHGNKVTVNGSVLNYSVFVHETENEDLNMIGVSIYNRSYKFIALKEDVSDFLVENILKEEFYERANP